MGQDDLQKVTAQFAKDVGAAFFPQNINRGNIALINDEWTIIVETFMRVVNERPVYSCLIKIPFLVKRNDPRQVLKQSRSLRYSQYEEIRNPENHKPFISFKILKGGQWFRRLLGISPNLPKSIDELYFRLRSSTMPDQAYLQKCYQYVLEEVIYLQNNNAAAPCKLPQFAPDYWMKIVGGL